MTHTPAQQLDAPTEPPRSQHAFAPEFLLRLLRLGSAQTIVVTSPDNLSATFIVDAVQTAAKSSPAIDRVGRHEELNDMTGRKLKVFRKSPRPPRARTPPDNFAADGVCAARKLKNAVGHEQDGVKTDPPIDRVGRFEVPNDMTGRELRVFRKSPHPPRARNSSDNCASDGVCAARNLNNAVDCERDGVEAEPPIDRVGRFEVLNDMTGRELRVFRKSPCPPLARNSSPASEDDALGGAYATECFTHVASREMKASPCLDLGRRPSLLDLVEDAVG
jgi:hypothetical protein